MILSKINSLFLFLIFSTIFINQASSQELRYRYKAEGVILGGKAVIPNNAPIIGTLNFPIPGVDVEYSYTLSGSDAEGDTLTWSWSGNTPSGLNINSSTGEISGTPDTAGSYSFQISLSDGNNNPVSRSVSVEVGDCLTGPVGSLCSDGSRYGGEYNSNRVYVATDVVSRRSWYNAVDDCTNKGGGYRLPSSPQEGIATVTQLALNDFIDYSQLPDGRFTYTWTSQEGSSSSQAVSFRLDGVISGNTIKTSVYNAHFCVRN